ncbi:vitamin-D-receptor interacting mediator subunit 4-domain-containing protein [Suillus placidus]|uniref:Mediator of RNA polymerase II transcription subunit 4 n=1 Tax=Suillus placidus TaxID=48579 RepID=A0A9P7A378_9AGAM|nr:vitamin-D-receptor interacting mediator subunit 4-domain-containing protein [Suillus placidus]
MDAQLLAPLTQLTALSQSLFLSLSHQPSQKQVPPPPLSSFAAVDAELQTALTTAAAHQRRQARIVALQQELLEVDARWRAVCEALEEGRKVLDEIVKEGDERVGCIRKAKEAAIPYPELLAYAQSLSAFTSAPPGLTMPEPGAVGPVPLFFPPFPNEEKMRRGRLNVERPLGGLGENHSVRAAPEPSPPPAQTRERPGVNPYRHDTRPQLAVFDLDLDLNPDL